MTLLQQANAALRDGQSQQAIAICIKAIQQNPELSKVLNPTIQLARQRWLKIRAADKTYKVIVCSSNLASNPAGRAVTLAQIYQTIADVEIVGCLFQNQTEIWSPIRDVSIPIHSIRIERERDFIAKAIEIVTDHPCDLLHISKPRFPNILIGILYKLIWGSKVVVDIDDEELSFVGAADPINLDDLIRGDVRPSYLTDLMGTYWTQVGVGLATAFDGVTVVNPALQEKYGGAIVRHARDPEVFKPSADRRELSRKALGILADQKVVIFLGTPRAHKGLVETAKAISALNRSDLIFLVVGDFPPGTESLTSEILSLLGSKVKFFPNQSFDTIPDTLAAGDICVLLQDPTSTVSQFQTPAKLTDALAMGLTVLAEPTPALADLEEEGAFHPVTRLNLPKVLTQSLSAFADKTTQSHRVFAECLTLQANSRVMNELLKHRKQHHPDSLSDRLNHAVLKIDAKGFLAALLRTPRKRAETVFDG